MATIKISKSDKLHLDAHLAQRAAELAQVPPEQRAEVIRQRLQHIAALFE